MKQIFAKNFIFYKGKCCFLKNCHLYCVKRSNSTVMAYGLFKRTIVPLIVSPPSPGLPDKAGDGDRAPCRSRAVFRPCRSRGSSVTRHPGSRHTHTSEPESTSRRHGDSPRKVELNQTSEQMFV